jgi:hypothetical protein
LFPDLPRRFARCVRSCQMSSANPKLMKGPPANHAGEGFYDGGDMIPGSGLGAELRLANLATSNVDPTHQAKTNVRHPRNDAVTDDGPVLRIQINDYGSSASRSATWRFIFRRAKRFVSVATARRRRFLGGTSGSRSQVFNFLLPSLSHHRSHRHVVIWLGSRVVVWHCGPPSGATRL